MQMKFSRSLNRSDDNGQALAEAGRALALQAVASLFAGREFPTHSWVNIAERYRVLLVASDGKPLEHEADAAGALAEVVCSPDPELAEGLASRIASASECE